MAKDTKSDKDKDKSKAKPKPQGQGQGGGKPGAQGAQAAKPAKPKDKDKEKDKAKAAEAAAPAPPPPPPPPRPPADPRAKVMKKFEGKFLPKGPLRGKYAALRARWDASPDHGDVTVEELKGLLAEWRATRAKPPVKAKVAAS